MSTTTNTIQFLKENPENFIWITNLANDTRIGKEKIFYSDIPNEDLKKFILNLSPSQDTLAWIEHRKKQGNTHVKVTGMSYKISFKEEVTEAPVMQSNQNLPVSTMQQNPYPNYPIENYPSPGLNSSYGLSAPEHRQMIRKADKYEAMEETLGEKSEELRKVKKDFDLQEIENRELKSKLAIAEQEKNMAIMLAKMENKSFLDSPAFEKLIEKAPEVFANMAAMKTGQLPANNGLSNPQNKLSEVKKDLVEFISDDGNNVQDDDVNFIGSALQFLPNPNFKSELQQLIIKYNG